MTAAPHHNNLTCYTDYHCRQSACVDRYNARNRERLRAQKAGTWNVLVDAEPVRRHILRLQTLGVGPGSIAATTGLPVQSVLDFIRPHATRRRGRRQRTTPDMAAKILAVTPENSISLTVGATATARRIQALVAIGWPLKHIARHAGLSHHNISKLLQRPRIHARTAKAIAATYDELRSKRPEKNDVTKGHANRARRWAAQERWAPPKYWDRHAEFLDDPHFTPEYGITRRQIIAEEAHWLTTIGGLNREQTAKRLGISKDALEKAISRYRGDLEEAA